MGWFTSRLCIDKGVGERGIFLLCCRWVFRKIRL
jgi:hypothetical protein